MDLGFIIWIFLVIVLGIVWGANRFIDWYTSNVKKLADIRVKAIEEYVAKELASVRVKHLNELCTQFECGYRRGAADLADQVKRDFNIEIEVDVRPNLQ
jgi:hypothetical protein